jgi:hypothetical protein
LNILESRLAKTKAILIQIFVVMMSTESESAQIISALQEMRFALDDAVQQVEKKGQEVVQQAEEKVRGVVQQAEKKKDEVAAAAAAAVQKTQSHL